LVLYSQAQNNNNNNNNNNLDGLGITSGSGAMSVVVSHQKPKPQSSGIKTSNRAIHHLNHLPYQWLSETETKIGIGDGTRYGGGASA